MMPTPAGKIKRRYNKSYCCAMHVSSCADYYPDTINKTKQWRQKRKIKKSRNLSWFSWRRSFLSPILPTPCAMPFCLFPVFALLAMPIPCLLALGRTWPSSIKSNQTGTSGNRYDMKKYNDNSTARSQNPLNWTTLLGLRPVFKWASVLVFKKKRISGR